ncbi:DUF3270 family protein [Lactococcus protaetiae]|uniref:DUF3270 family protein n=1 Tax=Lactococcus protaetiae TaxID=2592653 RepID=A0A514Z5R8_9LACT|nr:DUF3270 family protein [Lactococcus protaetiae]MCL2114130.1 DUF3270 domain-containing protein [Streptococcaceae bacterium]QDK69928.1 DUF3270 family protein [Lactococcus protaetiae]
MELRNLKDFYEKQEYYNYTETQGREQKQFNKRVQELTFFVNIAVFSVFLAIITYVLVSMLTSLIAVPVAFFLSLAVYISLKKGIAKVIKTLLK